MRSVLINEVNLDAKSKYAILTGFKKFICVTTNCTSIILQSKITAIYRYHFYSLCISNSEWFVL